MPTLVGSLDKLRMTFQIQSGAKFSPSLSVRGKPWCQGNGMDINALTHLHSDFWQADFHGQLLPGVDVRVVRLLERSL